MDKLTKLERLYQTKIALESALITNIENITHEEIRLVEKEWGVGPGSTVFTPMGDEYKVVKVGYRGKDTRPYLMGHRHLGEGRYLPIDCQLYSCWILPKKKGKLK